MSKNAIFGMLARYNSTPPTLQDGDFGGLQTDVFGAVKVTNILPGGTGTPRVGHKFGQPGRYNDNLIELIDGSPCALQLDSEGNLLIHYENAPPPDPPQIAFALTEGRETVGDTLVFTTNANADPDGVFTIHIMVEGGEPFTASMATNGRVGTYSWVTYYEPPFVDIDQEVEAWSTAEFSGDIIESNHQIYYLV